MGTETLGLLELTTIAAFWWFQERRPQRKHFT